MHPRWQIYYLIFMLAACGGALCWQLFLPELAADYSLWDARPAGNARSRCGTSHSSLLSAMPWQSATPRSCA